MLLFNHRQFVLIITNIMILSQKSKPQRRCGGVLFEIQKPLLNLYDAVFDGVDDKAGGVFTAALFEDVGAVFIDRTFRDI